MIDATRFLCKVTYSGQIQLNDCPDSSAVAVNNTGKNEYCRTITKHNMMTSSNGNIFRVTGHLCREFTGHR